MKIWHTLTCTGVTRYSSLSLLTARRKLIPLVLPVSHILVDKKRATILWYLHERQVNSGRKLKQTLNKQNPKEPEKCVSFNWSSVYWEMSKFVECKYEMNYIMGSCILAVLFKRLLFTEILLNTEHKVQQHHFTSCTWPLTSASTDGCTSNLINTCNMKANTVQLFCMFRYLRAFISLEVIGELRHMRPCRSDAQCFLAQHIHSITSLFTCAV